MLAYAEDHQSKKMAFHPNMCPDMCRMLTGKADLHGAGMIEPLPASMSKDLYKLVCSSLDVLHYEIKCCEHYTVTDLHGADGCVDDRPPASFNVKGDSHACKGGQNV